MRARKVLAQMRAPVKALAFLLVFLFLFHEVSDLFKIKQDYSKNAQLYTLPKNSVDVLLFGGSHMKDGVSTMDLWEEYGITAFNAGTSNATIPLNYYEMREAFKVCRPKVAVLDLYRIYYNKKLKKVSSLHYFADNVPMSPGVSEAIQDLLSAKYDKTEYYMSFYTYHNRWKELSGSDFLPWTESYMGSGTILYGERITGKRYNAISDQQTEPIPAVSEEYLRKIIQLCREEGIPLLLTTVPFSAGARMQRRMNRVREIAQEEGVPFLNFLDILDEIEFDPETDMSRWDHLNYEGVRKTTERLGEYLKANYDLEDRRGNGRIAKIYDDELVRYHAERDDKRLLLAESAEEYFEYINSRDYVVMWSAYQKDGLDDAGFNTLMELGSGPVSMSKETKYYCAITRNGESLYAHCARKKPINYSQMEADTLFTFGNRQDSKEVPVVYVGHTDCSAGKSGLNVVVFDPVANKVIDSVNISLNSHKISRL